MKDLSKKLVLSLMGLLFLAGTGVALADDHPMDHPVDHKPIHHHHKRRHHHLPPKHDDHPVDHPDDHH